MTSLEIAELTGKQHKDVMKAIRNMEPAWLKVNGRKFALVEYQDKKGELRPCYLLTKIECLYIATKFNDYAFLGENGTCNGKLQMVAIILFALVATCFAIITYFTRDKSKKVKVEGEDVPVAKD